MNAEYKRDTEALVRELRRMAGESPGDPTGVEYKRFLEAVAYRLEESQRLLETAVIMSGMLTRIERSHKELRAAWEAETGEAWSSASGEE
jgi:hypothetical protein